MVTYQQLLFFKRPLCVSISEVCTVEPKIPGVKNMHSRKTMWDSSSDDSA